MGSTIGKFARRTVKNWNVENRAHKLIEKHKDKPITAPLHPKDIKMFQKNKTDVNANILATEKNEDLHKMLQGFVVVESKNDSSVKSTEQLLPQDRSKKPFMEFGYLEPTNVKHGKCTIKQLMDIIGLHFEDPIKNNAESISKKYNLDKEMTEKLLYYYKGLDLFKPSSVENSDSKKLLIDEK